MPRSLVHLTTRLRQWMLQSILSEREVKSWSSIQLPAYLEEFKLRIEFLTSIQKEIEAVKSRIESSTITDLEQSLDICSIGQNFHSLDEFSSRLLDLFNESCYPLLTKRYCIIMHPMEMVGMIFLKNPLVCRIDSNQREIAELLGWLQRKLDEIHREDFLHELEMKASFNCDVDEKMQILVSMAVSRILLSIEHIFSSPTSNSLRRIQLPCISIKLQGIVRDDMVSRPLVTDGSQFTESLEKLVNSAARIFSGNKRASDTSVALINHISEHISQVMHKMNLIEGMFKLLNLCGNKGNVHNLRTYLQKMR